MEDRRASATYIRSNEMLLGIYPKTLGQYTGFTDCNGVKIFEHDIVEIYQTGEDTICKTLCSGYAARIEPKMYDKEKFMGYEQISFVNGSWYTVEQYPDHKNYTSLAWQINKNKYLKVKVVGNIFDNFELLEGRE